MPHSMCVVECMAIMFACFSKYCLCMCFSFLPLAYQPQLLSVAVNENERNNKTSLICYHRAFDSGPNLK